jgi:hypothetical protein
LNYFQKKSDKTHISYPLGILIIMFEIIKLKKRIFSCDLYEGLGSFLAASDVAHAARVSERCFRGKK